jgi:LmbE family N-acetylglucosaminyl deacetylase
MTERVLVVAAHPDDETLGCGGTIARLADQGADVNIAYLADGVSGRGKLDKAELDARRGAARKSCEILGAKAPSFLDFPDNRMDTLPRLEPIQAVEALIREHRPDTLLTHHAGDLNIDHRRVHEAVTTACRPQQGHPVRTLLFFEVASSTEWQPPGSGAPFLPNWFFDISDQLDAKLAALDAYAHELRRWPHPRSRKGIEHLARWRGACVGCDAAEAFILGRQLT